MYPNLNGKRQFRPVFYPNALQDLHPSSVENWQMQPLQLPPKQQRESANWWPLT